MKNQTRSLLFVFVLYLCSSFSAMAQQPERTVDLQVEGMISASCPVLLKSAVGKIKGVKKVEASLKDKTAKIEYDESQTSLKEIQDTIKAKVGFNTKIKNN